MGKTKEKLRAGEPVLGGWIIIGHPSVAKILAGEGFDWLAVDMEHTSTNVRTFHELSLAVKYAAGSTKASGSLPVASIRNFCCTPPAKCLNKRDEYE